jgi:hypothetical protein
MLVKKIVQVGLITIMLLSIAATALAATSDKVITYKDTKAIGALDTNFGISPFTSDIAKAWTNKSFGSYPIAVRLECWRTSSSSSMIYKYERKSTYAECNYTWSDVYCFKSRHSIDYKDGEGNWREGTVWSFSHKELSL